jgi:hypothetical protein
MPVKHPDMLEDSIKIAARYNLIPTISSFDDARSPQDFIAEYKFNAGGSIQLYQLFVPLLTLLSCCAVDFSILFDCSSWNE